MTQVLNPLTDVVQGSFTPNGAATLADCINDGSDATYIQSTGTAAFCEFTIDVADFVEENTNHFFKFRARCAGASSAESVTVSLYVPGELTIQGISQVITRSGSFSDYSVEVTNENIIGRLTNYGKLIVRITPTHTSGETIDISQFWVETPDGDLPAGQIIFHPDPSNNQVACDGYLSASLGLNRTWTQMREWANATASSATAQQSGTAFAVGLGTGSQANTYRRIMRTAFNFDTNGRLPAGTIESAYLRVTAYNATLAANMGLEVAVCSVALANDNTVVNGDLVYTKWGETDFATRVAFADWPADTEYVFFELNAAGIAAIKGDDLTRFGIRSGADLDNVEPTFPGTSIADVLGCYFVEQQSAPLYKKDYSPRLIINYAAPASTTKFIPWICGDSYG